MPLHMQFPSQSGEFTRVPSGILVTIVDAELVMEQLLMSEKREFSQVATTLVVADPRENPASEPSCTTIVPDEPPATAEHETVAVPAFCHSLTHLGAAFGALALDGLYAQTW